MYSTYYAEVKITTIASPAFPVGSEWVPMYTTTSGFRSQVKDLYTD